MTKAFELTQEEIKKITEKAAAEKPEGGKKEALKRAAVKKALDFFGNLTQDAANDYIAKNVRATEITKALMAAYIKTYANTEDEKVWVKGEFKKASTKTATKKVSTVCMGGNGLPIHKINKNGKAVAKTVRVDSITGETYETFDLSGARKEFIAHFKITPLASKFTPKAKRKTEVYDEFADLF